MTGVRDSLRTQLCPDSLTTKLNNPKVSSLLLTFYVTSQLPKKSLKDLCYIPETIYSGTNDYIIGSKRSLCLSYTIYIILNRTC